MRTPEERRNASWRSLEGTSVVSTQEEKLLNTLRIFGPMTSRELHERTGIERTSVTRALKGLEKKLDTTKEIVCPVTKRPATLYRVL